jgi:hypothetical protein
MFPLLAAGGKHGHSLKETVNASKVEAFTVSF